MVKEQVPQGNGWRGVTKLRWLDQYLGGRTLDAQSLDAD
jgi:hypothetical protein